MKFVCAGHQDMEEAKQTAEDPSAAWALERFWHRRQDANTLEAAPQPVSTVTADSQSRYVSDFQVRVSKPIPLQIHTCERAAK